MDQIETVLFDLDKTIIRLSLSTTEVLARTFNHLGIEQPFSAEEYATVRKQYESTTFRKRQLREKCFVTLLETEGYPPSVGQRAAATYSRLRETAGIDYRPGAQSVINQLSERYPIGLVTNGPEDEQQAKIEAIGLEEYLDVVVFAGNDIPAKPHSRAFSEALSRLNTSPQNAVFVGDSVAEDVTGAADVGMTTVWLSNDDHPSPDTKPDFRIQSLGELLPPPWEDR
ncbi:HAD family hydrolase [Halosimplex litoreum]|uniref:HAD family hydrolase n=1 Tax=Halosimplex litoreum TaxID=1198301 RepID=A0A7T3G0S4_9EURY|nr:HAD family hydrolase [Halosimplex litoreum]QPV64270.1 HAD family hydrolase [Halosimplex litoreum]